VKRKTSKERSRAKQKKKAQDAKGERKRRRQNWGIPRENEEKKTPIKGPISVAPRLTR